MFGLLRAVIVLYPPVHLMLPNSSASEQYLAFNYGLIRYAIFFLIKIQYFKTTRNFTQVRNARYFGLIFRFALTNKKLNFNMFNFFHELWL